jgi:(2Fe-2S) ferredoxin
MWYTYVDPSEIMMVEYHVGEGEPDEDEPAPKKPRKNA